MRPQGDEDRPSRTRTLGKPGGWGQRRGRPADSCEQVGGELGARPARDAPLWLSPAQAQQPHPAAEGGSLLIPSLRMAIGDPAPRCLARGTVAKQSALHTWPLGTMSLTRPSEAGAPRRGPGHDLQGLVRAAQVL